MISLESSAASNRFRLENKFFSAGAVTGCDKKECLPPRWTEAAQHPGDFIPSPENRWINSKRGFFLRAGRVVAIFAQSRLRASSQRHAPTV